MVKSKLDVVQWGADRLRIGPWRGDARTAFLAPVAGRPASVATISRGLRVLAAKGYESVLTAALSRTEQQPFAELGFVVHERLHLLRHDLRDLPGPPPVRMRRALPFDQGRILELDARAFDHFWRFDREGLADARRATPSSRFRVAERSQSNARYAGAAGIGRNAPAAGSGRFCVVGYAITGRAGDVGYLQRLAVDPDHHHQGIGSALVLDSLWWARRRGALVMLVNTQETNTAAQRLYQRLGFAFEEHGLAVLERSLVEPWS
jgi:ribosomal protein S18 acetylase RimI-like enzyme